MMLDDIGWLGLWCWHDSYQLSLSEMRAAININEVAKFLLSLMSFL